MQLYVFVNGNAHYIFYGIFLENIKNSIPSSQPLVFLSAIAIQEIASFRLVFHILKWQKHNYIVKVAILIVFISISCMVYHTYVL